MDSPFFRSQWNQPSIPRYSPTARGIPIHTVHQKSSPKVVSIPVHFVESETTRSSSALKIQKAFRGFLVRKNVKRIASIRSQVDEIERRISRSETAELLRRCPKERLRVNETLMSLLFKLDSVRGVDSGVRDCRKAVIKKTIALQEKVDAIVVAVDDQTLAAESNYQGMEVDNSDSLAKAVDQTVEIEDSAECLVESVNHTRGKELNLEDSIDNSAVGCNNASLETALTERMAPQVEDPASVLKNTNCSAIAVDETLEVEGSDEFAPSYCKTESKDEGAELAAENRQMMMMDITEVGADSRAKTNEEPCVVKEIVERLIATTRTASESVETWPTDNWSGYSADAPRSLIEGGEEHTSGKLGGGLEVLRRDQTEGDRKDSKDVGGRDDTKGNRQLPERMMEDNEKMMSLMTQFFERNEMQTRMLNTLTHRVEQLEKAFVCDRMRRKKKRHSC